MLAQLQARQAALGNLQFQMLLASKYDPIDVIQMHYLGASTSAQFKSTIFQGYKNYRFSTMIILHF